MLHKGEFSHSYWSVFVPRLLKSGNGLNLWLIWKKQKLLALFLRGNVLGYVHLEDEEDKRVKLSP
jgi:hypothetical protein